MVWRSWNSNARPKPRTNKIERAARSRFVLCVQPLAAARARGTRDHLSRDCFVRCHCTVRARTEQGDLVDACRFVAGDPRRSALSREVNRRPQELALRVGECRRVCPGSTLHWAAQGGALSLRWCSCGAAPGPPSIAERATLAGASTRITQMTRGLSPRADVRVGSGPTKLPVSTTSPVIPQLRHASGHR